MDLERGSSADHFLDLHREEQLEIFSSIQQKKYSHHVQAQLKSDLYPNYFNQLKAAF